MPFNPEKARERLRALRERRRKIFENMSKYSRHPETFDINIDELARKYKPLEPYLKHESVVKFLELSKKRDEIKERIEKLLDEIEESINNNELENARNKISEIADLYHEAEKNIDELSDHYEDAMKRLKVVEIALGDLGEDNSRVKSLTDYLSMAHIRHGYFFEVRDDMWNDLVELGKELGMDIEPKKIEYKPTVVPIPKGAESLAKRVVEEIKKGKEKH